jgi:predicted phosphodiesterase
VIWAIPVFANHDRCNEMLEGSLLIVSDAHADPGSLNSVISLAESRGPVSKRVFLGDGIGYGSDPVGVLEILQRFEVCILGNHELLALDMVSRWNYNRRAAKIIDQHAEVIGDQGRTFLKTFRRNYQEDRMIFFHGTPTIASDYPFNDTDIRRILDEFTDFDIFFGGHLHMPRLAVLERQTCAITFEETVEPISAHSLDTLHHRYFINCPSAMPGRFGYSTPGCCRLSWLNEYEAELEFLFVK